MMQIVENIHATDPPYATVVPILRATVRPRMVDRGTTFNNGAADAAGR
jgi:hypothetical protein